MHYDVVFDLVLSLNFTTCFSGYAVAQWLGIRLQMLGVAMVTGVSFIAMLEHHFNTVDPGTCIYIVHVVHMWILGVIE